MVSLRKMERKKNRIIEGGSITCPFFDFPDRRDRLGYR